MSSPDYETESSQAGVPPNDWHLGEEDLATLSQHTSPEQPAQGLTPVQAAHGDSLNPPPAMPGDSPPGEDVGDHPDHSEASAEEEHYSPAPIRGLELVTGNGPVPRERGNIGDSIGTAPGPSNGV